MLPQGLAALWETPHGLLRLGSWIAASPGRSETRLVWMKSALAGGEMPVVARARTAKPVMRDRKTERRQGNFHVQSPEKISMENDVSRPWNARLPGPRDFQ